MGNENAREVQQWSEAKFCQNRYYNYFGSDMPMTISVKELGGDNAIDQISDGRTNLGYIEIGEDFKSVTVMDGGRGISTKKTMRQDTEKMSTFLYLAVAKLYTSTNYDEDNGSASNTVGQNGVGATVSNFLSSHYTVGIVSKNPEKHNVKNVISIMDESKYSKEVHSRFYDNPTGAVYGYHFQDGEPTIDGTPMDQETPEWIGINVPKFYGEDETFGFLFHAEYNRSVIDEGINIDWIRDYIKTRLGECKIKDKDIYLTFRYPEEKDDIVTMKEIIFVRAVEPTEFSKINKDKIDNKEMFVISSWEDYVNEVKKSNPEDVFGPFSIGYYQVFYAKDSKLLEHIPNIVQGAQVTNSKQIPITFDVGNTTIKIPVPCVFKLDAKIARGLTYTDQTKRKLGSNKKTPPKINLNCLEIQFNRTPELKEHFERIANEKFLEKSGKKISSDFYWKATGGETAREFFSKDVDSNKSLAFILNSIKDDLDVIEYCAKNNISIETLEKAVNE